MAIPRVGGHSFDLGAIYICEHLNRTQHCFGIQHIFAHQNPTALRSLHHYSAQSRRCDWPQIKMQSSAKFEDATGGRRSLRGRIIHEVKMERCEIQRGSYSRTAPINEKCSLYILWLKSCTIWHIWLEKRLAIIFCMNSQISLALLPVQVHLWTSEKPVH